MNKETYDIMRDTSPSEFIRSGYFLEIGTVPQSGFTPANETGFDPSLPTPRAFSVEWYKLKDGIKPNITTRDPRTDIELITDSQVSTLEEALEYSQSFFEVRDPKIEGVFRDKSSRGWLDAKLGHSIRLGTTADRRLFTFSAINAAGESLYGDTSNYLSFNLGNLLGAAVYKPIDDE